MIAQSLIDRLVHAGNEKEAQHLSRFFKTGHGEYGEGDCFLGVRVPDTRRLVKEYKDRLTLNDIIVLTDNKYHEVRLAGFLLLVEMYNTSKRHENDCKVYIDLYVDLLDRANNWDLIDLVAPKILGDYLLNHTDERAILYDLATMEGNLWHQRAAMVSCWTLIRSGDFYDGLRLAEHFITHKHDLIHKATGWMLREIGKRGGDCQLHEFLNRHASEMPRTMLRYAIERLSGEERTHYMKL